MQRSSTSRVSDTVKQAAGAVSGAASSVRSGASVVTDGVQQVGGNITGVINRIGLFIDGTIRGMLNFTAKFGRKGLFVGMFAGLAGMLVPGGIPVAFLGGEVLTGLALPFFGALGGAVAGSVLGAVAGILRGGAERLELENRKDKYAAQLDENRRASRTSTRRKDGPNTTFARASEQLDRVNFDRFTQHNDMVDRLGLNTSNGSSYREKLDEAREAELSQLAQR
jgi:hypothetical protein